MAKHFLFKILVGGDAGVGKTSLLRRYVNDMFDESSIMTVGVDFFLKQVEIDTEMKISLQLWDLGGQERFRHLLPSYVMGARGAIILFDLTRMPDFNSILKWVNLVRMHDISIPIIFVGAKEDLGDLIAIDDEIALQIKDTFNMLAYVKTSAKTGHNVNLVFEIMAKKLMNIKSMKF